MRFKSFKDQKKKRALTMILAIITPIKKDVAASTSSM